MIIIINSNNHQLKVQIQHHYLWIFKAPIKLAAKWPLEFRQKEIVGRILNARQAQTIRCWVFSISNTKVCLFVYFQILKNIKGNWWQIVPAPLVPIILFTGDRLYSQRLTWLPDKKKKKKNAITSITTHKPSLCFWIWKNGNRMI